MNNKAIIAMVFVALVVFMYLVFVEIVNPALAQYDLRPNWSATRPAEADNAWFAGIIVFAAFYVAALCYIFTREVN